MTQSPAPTLHNLAHLADLLEALGQDCSLLLRDDSPLTTTVIHEHLARIAPYAAGLVTLAAAPNAPYRDSDQEHRARPRIALAAQDTHFALGHLAQAVREAIASLVQTQNTVPEGGVTAETHARCAKDEIGEALEFLLIASGACNEAAQQLAA